MNIILIGLKHSGKSSIGKTLSLMLDRIFFDTDEILKTLFFEKFQKKKNIFEIYKFLKEEKFRSIEKEVFFLLKDIKNCVIATGGGSVLNETFFQILKNPKIIVYLKASIDILKKRIQKQKQNSIFQDEKFFENTFENRKDIYENLSDITIQTDDKDIEKIAFEIKNKIDPKHLKKIKNTQCEAKYLYV